MRLVFVFLLAVSTVVNAQKIFWENPYQLQWEDFKGNPIKESPAAARTSSGFTFNYTIYTSKGKPTGFKAEVKTRFNPNKSWYKKDKANDYILRHEQFHFNMSEVCARALRQQLLALEITDDLKEKLEALNTKYFEKLKKSQKEYDHETNHSINKEVQEEFENVILEELEFFKAFTDPIIERR